MTNISSKANLTTTPRPDALSPFQQTEAVRGASTTAVRLAKLINKRPVRRLKSRLP